MIKEMEKIDKNAIESTVEYNIECMISGSMEYTNDDILL